MWILLTKLTYLVHCIDFNSRSDCLGLPGRSGVQAFDDVVIWDALGSGAKNHSCRICTLSKITGLCQLHFGFLAREAASCSQSWVCVQCLRL